MWSTLIWQVRSREQLDDVLGALDFTIPEPHLAALDDVSRIDLGFPQVSDLPTHLPISPHISMHLARSAHAYSHRVAPGRHRRSAAVGRR